MHLSGGDNEPRPRRTGTVEVFNNTLYDCAANGTGGTLTVHAALSGGGGPPGLMMRLRNNIVYQLPGEIYTDGSKAQITARNLWFGAGNRPTQTTGNINGDPQFIDLGKFDFHLRPTARPARDAGATVLPNNPFVIGNGHATDKDGVAHPQGKAFDLGAYETPR